VHGPDEELQRVAAVMDAEVRAEQAAYEAMALQAHWRGRRLADVASELVVRGDEVEVLAAGDPLVGTVVHAGSDYAVIETSRGQVDVQLAAMDLLRVTRRVRRGGRPPGRGARTLRARLTEHEVAGVPVRLLTRGAGEVDGVILAVAVDHVLVRTRRGEVAIPDGQVVAVIHHA
jgi:hypothetical protein